MRKAFFWGLFALALVLGLALRLPRLDARPMHHDEANQALKFGGLLETGQYRYDPADHHGPTLYYLTLPAAWWRGQTTLAALDERTLRVVPALFGAATILMCALFARGLGRHAVVAAALLAAISPAITYYSRFYIQETLLVFFGLGVVASLGRYALDPRLAPALTVGVCAGLAFATKETAAIVVAAALVACGSARAIVRRRLPQGTLERWPQVRAPLTPRAVARHAVVAVAAAAIVAATLYSSFFTNAAGVLGAMRSFGSYVDRGLHPNAHVESWYYYVRLLAWSTSGGLVWTEGLVLLLAVVGMVRSVTALRTTPDAPRTDPGPPRLFWPVYLTLYSLLTCAGFSAIRYKTPWNLLPFYIGFVLVAGYGVAGIVRLEPSPARGISARFAAHGARAVTMVALLIAAVQLAGQDWRANFRYGADPRNPYAYVHTSSDFLRLVERVHGLAAVHADSTRMLVKVVAGPYEQWPLPWYLRRMPRVGYWTTASSAAPLDGTPVIIASAENAAALDGSLGDRYQSEFYGLRPNVLLTVYIERGLWEKYLAKLELRKPKSIVNSR